MTGMDAAGRRRRQEDTVRFCTEETGGQPVLRRQDWHDLGWTDDAVRHQVRSGRWSRPFRGFAVAEDAPLDVSARVRLAWLAAGREATVSGRAAAYLLGIGADPPREIEVQVPHGRRPSPRPGCVFRHVRRPREHRLVAGVRVTTVEETVLDLVSSTKRFVDAIPWIERACGQRLTTPSLLVDASERRARMRHRREVQALCGRLAEGEASWLERWCADDVIRRHGLPRGRRQVRRVFDGRVTYSDMEFERHRLVVELDGRLGHDGGAFRDMWRDNAHAADGRTVLRYGYTDARRSPCAVAAQIATVLERSGWRGRLRRCGAACTLSSL